MAHYNARMMKKLIAAGFAALTAVAIAGCGSDEKSAPVSAAAPSSSESFTIDSWSALGRAGTQWFDECATDDFACYDSQVSALLTSASTLTADATHSTRGMESYRDAYAKYVAANCPAATYPCSTLTTQLGTLRDGLQTGLERMANEG